MSKNTTEIEVNSETLRELAYKLLKEQQRTGEEVTIEVTPGFLLDVSQMLEEYERATDNVNEMLLDDMVGTDVDN